MTDISPHHNRRWTILAILGLAQLMVVLDATIVNIALPSAQKALHFSNDNRQWIVTAYALAFGSLLLLGGRISDLFGRKWTFIAGLSGFAVASAVGGAAPSFGMLVASRSFQGAFGALLAPAALSLLTTTFTDGAERAKAFGIYGAIAGSGASIGLLLGGVLTQTLNWRFAMYVNLIFAVIAVTGAVMLLHNSRPAQRPRLDIPGTLAVSGGLLALRGDQLHRRPAAKPGTDRASRGPRLHHGVRLGGRHLRPRRRARGAPVQEPPPGVRAVAGGSAGALTNAERAERAGAPARAIRERGAGPASDALASSSAFLSPSFAGPGWVDP